MQTWLQQEHPQGQDSDSDLRCWGRQVLCPAQRPSPVPGPSLCFIPGNEQPEGEQVTGF